ncbi:MAG: LL-diaminopimelate aminotransferase [Deltaproteobacteria bacterium]|jgi:LL-diaminopimelate aminotransferase|nr:LL-diaminopimelate aminotransferase [Deltaproteobacteria bacterium]
MPSVNPYYDKLPGSYLFSEIGRRVREFTAAHPRNRLIRLGIGDVTSPLPPSVIRALHRAVEEQADPEGFKGYGPEQGYEFLRRAIVEDSFRNLGITPEEIFVSDGAKCDLGNFQELFDLSCKVAVTDPVYPVYVDSNVMAGRGGEWKDGRFSGIIYLPCNAENNFVPDLPRERPDLIYLCYPNNPTGTVLTKDQLQVWVDYAREKDCLILYDSAYEAYISGPDLPRSIYELEGARDVAVEFRSYSKLAGFTGLRCGYVVLPRTVPAGRAAGGGTDLWSMWLRRQSTKYNGCPYIVQRAAEAVHSQEGRAETRTLVKKYMDNARVIRAAFEETGFRVYGGEDAPYVWVKLPAGLDSWSFFDRLLHEAEIVGTPGAGFGPSGEGYFRLTGFGDPSLTEEAAARLKRMYKAIPE